MPSFKSIFIKISISLLFLFPIGCVTVGNDGQIKILKTTKTWSVANNYNGEIVVGGINLEGIKSCKDLQNSIQQKINGLNNNDYGAALFYNFVNNGVLSVDDNQNKNIDDVVKEQAMAYRKIDDIYRHHADVAIDDQNNGVFYKLSNPPTTIGGFPYRSICIAIDAGITPSQMQLYVTNKYIKNTPYSSTGGKPGYRFWTMKEFKKNGVSSQDAAKYTRFNLEDIIKIKDYNITDATLALYPKMSVTNIVAANSAGLDLNSINKYRSATVEEYLSFKKHNIIPKVYNAYYNELKENANWSLAVSRNRSISFAIIHLINNGDNVVKFKNRIQKGMKKDDKIKFYRANANFFNEKELYTINALGFNFEDVLGNKSYGTMDLEWIIIFKEYDLSVNDLKKYRKYIKFYEGTNYTGQDDRKNYKINDAFLYLHQLPEITIDEYTSYMDAYYNVEGSKVFGLARLLTGNGPKIRLHLITSFWSEQEFKDQVNSFTLFKNNQISPKELEQYLLAKVSSVDDIIKYKKQGINGFEFNLNN